MTTAGSRMIWTVGLMGVSVVALAGEPKPAPASEPVGFITGGVIGAFAAGPVGAVIGAGIGTWLGNRVHRAGEVGRAESRAVALEGDKAQLQSEKSLLQTENTQLQSERSSLLAQTGNLAETNRELMARLEQVSTVLDTAAASEDVDESDETSKVLDGVQGEVLFRTASAEVPPDTARGITVLAQAVAKSPNLKVRLDGYADPRGGADRNLQLSQQRAAAIRDLFLAAGVGEEALEVNAYGKSQSVAQDADGYALERRVRLTLRAEGTAQTAKLNEKQ